MPGSADVLHEVVALTRARLAVVPGNGAGFVCVDGPSGSGKTTLATDLVDALAATGADAALLHMDDFYEGWGGLGPSLEPRLLSQVFEPLASGRAGRWQRYDWAAERLGGWVDLPLCDVVVLEGCGSGAAAYGAYRSVLVWVEAPREDRLARGVARDGEAARAHLVVWMEAEDRHFAGEQTRDRADVVIET